jgi:hypothetical protein
MMRSIFKKIGVPACFLPDAFEYVEYYISGWKFPLEKFENLEEWVAFYRKLHNPYKVGSRWFLEREVHWAGITIK